MKQLQRQEHIFCQQKSLENKEGFKLKPSDMSLCCLHDMNKRPSARKHGPTMSENNLHHCVNPPPLIDTVSPPFFSVVGSC